MYMPFQLRHIFSKNTKIKKMETITRKVAALTLNPDIDSHEIGPSALEEKKTRKEKA